MTTPTVDGRPLLEATITEPETGAWCARVTCDHDAALTGQVTIAIDGTEWVGTVTGSSVESGKVLALIYGGAGALASDDAAAVTVAAKSYRGASLGTVVADLATATGETLEAGALALLGAVRVPAWSRSESPAKRALEAIATKAGVSWRVLRDGTVWIGVETWPDAGGSPIQTDADPARGLYELRDGLSVRPGTVYGGQRIRHCVHRLERAGLVTEAWTRAPGAVFARQRELARRETDMAQLWPAQVAGQRADGTLEVIPDDERMRGTGIDGAVICPGLPGMLVTVPAGSRCLLAFAGGDPSRPRVVAWDSDTTVTLIRLGGAGSDFVALAGRVLTELQNIKTAYDLHTHPTGVGPSGVPAAALPAPTSVACTRFRTA